MATPKIVPRAAGEGALGDAAYGWGGAFVTNTTTSSATQGGKLVLAADDGAVMATGHYQPQTEATVSDEGYWDVHTISSGNDAIKPLDV